MRGYMRMRNREDMLDRIIILLLALAGLAEHAAGVPAPVRCLVLWPLRLADAVASEFVARFAPAVPNLSPPAQSGRHGFDRADALAIALSLRTLAATLQAIVRQMRLSTSHPKSSVGDDRSIRRRTSALDAAMCMLVHHFDSS